METKSRVGEKSQIYRAKVTSGQVAEFRASLVGAPSSAEPPVALLAAFRKGEKELTESLGFTLSHLLHAGQDYEFVRELPVEQEFEYQSSLLSVLEKRSRDSRGGMIIFSIGTDYRIGEQVFATSQSTVIYRP